jgi:glucose-1-phosphate thymidylyltransferase
MSTWGIIPAAGDGGRVQPFAYSKELMPVGSRIDGEVERPRAVTEYLLERMIAGGAKKICFVISPGKSDILEYFGGRIDGVDIAYVVQPKPVGLCDALFRAVPVVAPGDRVLIGLPDTIWFPPDGFALLPQEGLSFLLFPVSHPEHFDAVLTDAADKVLEIQVKQPQPHSAWIWGAVSMDGGTFHELYQLWREPGRNDEYLGTLVNAFVGRGGRAIGVKAGLAYVDVGTVNGYREAIHLLNGHHAEETTSHAEATGYTDGWRPLTTSNYAHSFPQQRIEVESLPHSTR